MKKHLLWVSVAALVFSCGNKTVRPERLKDVKAAVAHLDSAVTAMYGWEPRDSTYDTSLDTLVAGIMSEIDPDNPRYQVDDGMHAIPQQTYDESRETWDVFKQLIDADKYEEALAFYFGESEVDSQKKAGDFLIFLKHSTQRYVFFSEVLFPLMQEYRDADSALEEYIGLLQLEKAMEDFSIALHAENTGYVPEVYPRVVRDLGMALASVGEIDEARKLFYDLIDGIYGLTGNALFANYIASIYAADLYLLEGNKEDAISNWNRFKDAIEQSKSDYDPDEVETCLRAIEREIEKLQ